MKIFFYENRSNLKFNPNTAKNIGTGSLHVSIIELAREFSEYGNDVTCFVPCNTPDLYDGVKYYDVSSYKEEECDLFIGVESFPKNIKARKVINWVHRNNSESAERFLQVDKIVVLSEYHKELLLEDGFPSSEEYKLEVIPNGIDHELFDHDVEKKREIVCTAFPTKGLIWMKEIYPRIVDRLGKIPLHIYSSGELWGWDDQQFRSMYNDMIKRGILFHGNIGREILGERLAEFKIFLYPCTFDTPFGYSTLEAMSAGCVPVTTDKGNLKNIIDNGKNGFIVEGDPSNYMWQHSTADRIEDLLMNKDLFSELSSNAKRYSKEYTWGKTRKGFEKLYKFS